MTFSRLRACRCDASAALLIPLCRRCATPWAIFAFAAKQDPSLSVTALLCLNLLETEDALIPDDLHIVGKPPSDAALAGYLSLIDADDDTRAKVEAHLRGDTELDGMMRALSARYVAPVPGGA